jgi:hypothetical protein
VQKRSGGGGGEEVSEASRRCPCLGRSDPLRVTVFCTVIIGMHASYRHMVTGVYYSVG